MADEKQSSLTVLGGPLAGSQTSLPGHGVVTIGSAADCSFQLSVPSVSPLHARIVVEEGHATVETVDSDRPLHINDNPLVEGSAELRNGDILWLGAPGEEDVVMLQCILPPVAEPVPAAAPPSGDPTPEVETQALYTAPADAEAPPPEAGGEATVAYVPESDAEAEPPAAEGAKDDEPLILAFDSSTEDEEEEAVLVDDPGFGMPADDGAAPPAEAPAPAEPVVPGEDAFVAEPAPTIVTGPDDVDLSGAPPTVALPPEGVAEVPTVEPIVETPEPPPAPTPEPPAAPPAPPEPPAPKGEAPAAARPRDRSAPGPGASARRSRPPSLRRGPKPPPRPASDDAPEAAAGGGASRSPALFAVAGFVAVVVVAGLGFALWRFVLAKPTPAATPAPVAAATAAPPPVAPTPAPPLAPLPDTAPTPAPVATPTPAPAATPTPAAAQPTPTPEPRATPTPTPPPAPAPAAAAPAGPSPAELQAQQNAARVQELLGLSDTAIAARQYEAAVGHLDEALRLEPGNSRATTTRARAVALRDLALRRFVTGRTRVQTAKASGGGGLAGFDTGGADLRQAPDFQGRLEFEMTPPSGIAGGDSWALRVFVINDGKKSIDVQGVATTTRINGNASEGALTPATRQIQTQQRVLIAESSGTWSDGTNAWSTQVKVTAKNGDSLSATLTWK